MLLEGGGVWWLVPWGWRFVRAVGEGPRRRRTNRWGLFLDPYKQKSHKLETSNDGELPESEVVSDGNNVCDRGE